jgi:alkanesulfonate monooxygenase SsuD/methylene tetrahydromethanopterin reductase-like flavin-dependent oxidoreductase (luciferase family)
VQDKHLAKDYADAMAAVPLEFIDATSLLGPRERIAEHMTAFAEAGVTTLTVAPYPPEPSLTSAAPRTAPRTAVEAFELAGVA